MCFDPLIRAKKGCEFVFYDYCNVKSNALIEFTRLTWILSTVLNNIIGQKLMHIFHVIKAGKKQQIRNTKTEYLKIS